MIIFRAFINLYYCFTGCKQVALQYSEIYTQGHAPIYDMLLNYFTPLQVYSHDSSLSVLPVAKVTIAQWDSSLSVVPVARVQFPTMAEYSKGFFPG